MGWLEMQTWLGVMQRQREGASPDPERWTEASDENFQSLREQRDKLRGR